MVDEVRRIAEVGRVHGVQVALAQVEIEVEQVRLTVGVIDLEI